MPRILYNPESDTLIRWPRQDDEDVVGLQPPTVMLTVERQPQPDDYDPAVYGLEPTEDVDLDALVLRKGWELVELPPTPHWVQFALALAGSDEIKALLWAIESVNPVLRDMMSVGLGQAAEGNANTFLAAWKQAAGAGLVSAELTAQMQSLAAGFDLPAEFVEGLG
jgi:hypothetical protein